MRRPLGKVPAWLLAGLGLGWSPRAPGTVASLGAALLVFAAEALAGAGVWAGVLLLVAGSAITLVWGGRATGPEGHGDPGWVVSDEWAGQALPSIVAAVAGTHVLWHALAFVLFRLLDISKPGPIRRLELLPGGRGVLADDLAAGAVAAVLLGGGILAARAFLGG